MRGWLVAAAGGWLVVAAPARQSAAPSCDSGPPAVTSPSRDLYCMELVPRPGMEGSGVVELGRASSPYDVALTPEGSTRYQATLVLAGLPAPSSLGPYSAWVAWVAPPSLTPMRALGKVGNGRFELGEIAWDKFVVFVSAERSATATRQTGRVVLRGFSPSIRMQQHSMDMPTGRSDAAHDHTAMKMPDSVRWFMPPSRPRHRMVAMPGVDELVPAVAPWLPGAGVDPSRLPEARAREVITPRDGDTLTLTASLVRRTLNGRRLVMYAYNGQVPGPLLSVKQGTSIVVRFRNAIDMPSAVHWHGLRLENASDGAPGVTQEEVKPGNDFVYRVRFPDEGVYWYHPHVREDIQQDLGLYGNMLVRPERPDAFAPANREEVLMLDDILLGEAGLVPYSREATTHSLMGRFGNILLVNGETSWSATARPGEVMRLYLTNVSNTRTFNVGIPGTRMKLVGADIGRYTREAWVDHVTIAPAQRYIVDVRMPGPGRFALVNRVQAIDHNVGNFFPEVDTLGVIRVSGAPASPDHAVSFRTLRTNRDVVTDVERYRSWFTRAPDKDLLLTLRLGNLPYGVMQMLRKDAAYAHPVEMSGTMPMMDWLATSRETEWVMRDLATGRENMAINWRFRLGEVVKIRLSNDRSSLHPMGHPIHLHGQRFLVLSHNGVPSTNLVWKDTVLLPVGGTVELLVEMTNPGKWMMHCHIAEHLQSGMMGVFEVG